MRRSPLSAATTCLHSAASTPCLSLSVAAAASVGRIMATKKIKVVNPATLEPVKVGDVGELLVSSDFMVTNYLNKPEETAESFIEIISG